MGNSPKCGTINPQISQAFGALDGTLGIDWFSIGTTRNGVVQSKRIDCRLNSLACNTTWQDGQAVRFRTNRLYFRYRSFRKQNLDDGPKGQFNHKFRDEEMKSGIRFLALVGLSTALFSGCNFVERRQCNQCNGQIGCRPCPVGWQRGGTDYGAHLNGHGGALRGRLGQGGYAGAAAASSGAPYGHGMHGEYLADTQTQSGIQAPAVAYPYYTTRGPRDFFVNNPPPIGR
jgi:hypothetical protein